MSEQLTVTPDFFIRDESGNEYAGRHLHIELWGAKNLTNPDFIEEKLKQAALNCGAGVLFAHMHPFDSGKHNDSCGGVTGVVLLSESHITIHTWPEKDYAAIDVFMCGECDPQNSVSVIESAFSPKSVDVKLHKRGFVEKDFS